MLSMYMLKTPLNEQRYATKCLWSQCQGINNASYYNDVLLQSFVITLQYHLVDYHNIILFIDVNAYKWLKLLFAVWDTNSMNVSQICYALKWLVFQDRSSLNY